MVLKNLDLGSRKISKQLGGSRRGRYNKTEAEAFPSEVIDPLETASGKPVTDHVINHVNHVTNHVTDHVKPVINHVTNHVTDHVINHVNHVINHDTKPVIKPVTDHVINHDTKPVIKPVTDHVINHVNKRPLIARDLNKTELKIVNYLIPLVSSKSEPYETEIIKLKHLSGDLGLKLNTVRQTLIRMTERGWFSKPKFFDGPRGGTCHIFTPEAWKVLSNHVINHADRLIDSNSFLNQSLLLSFPDEWRSIDFTILDDFKAPLNIDHLRQFYTMGIRAEVVRQSIMQFYLALKHKWEPKGGWKKSKLRYFLACMENDHFFEWPDYPHFEKIQKQNEEIFLERTKEVETEPEFENLFS
jgi:hypothetical protein